MKLLSRLLKFLGFAMLMAALLLSFANRSQARQAAEKSDAVLHRLSPAIPTPQPTLPPSAAASAQQEIPDYILNPQMDMPTLSVDGNEYIGILSIPSQELSLPVISQWSYEALKLAPCRYDGSPYTNDLVIAAHNYPRHFGGLSGLSYGDGVEFTDVDGNVFRYRVIELEILPPHAVEEMHTGNPGLSLFTCTIGGEKRVTLRAELIEN